MIIGCNIYPLPAVCWLNFMEGALSYQYNENIPTNRRWMYSVGNIIRILLDPKPKGVHVCV